MIEKPFRSELFSAEQMDGHGAALARLHKIPQGTVVGANKTTGRQRKILLAVPDLG